ncbi:MAG TPA: TetR/AcrR family transcriptional regulator [Kofleriaceae bacterium]|jgi:AcrR family transcriptional regulator
MSTREQTKHDTREALVKAALAEFAEHGLDASLDAICARAGFTRGAFYVHFKDRDDLVVAAIDKVLSRHQDMLLAGGDLRATIVRFIALVMTGEGVTTGTPSWRFRHTLDACARLPAVRARYLKLQRQGVARVAASAAADQKSGTVRDDIDAHALAELLVVLTLGMSAASELGLPIDVLAGGAVLQRMLRSTRSKSS